MASRRWLDDVVEGSLGDQPLSSFKQTGIGGDFNYARGHLILYGAAAWSRWDVPNVEDPVDALSAFLETRYRLIPGLYVAGRLDRLTFSDITSRSGQGEPWEVPAYPSGDRYRLFLGKARHFESGRSIQLVRRSYGAR